MYYDTDHYVVAVRYVEPAEPLHRCVIGYGALAVEGLDKFAPFYWDESDVFCLVGLLLKRHHVWPLVGAILNC